MILASPNVLCTHSAARTCGYQNALRLASFTAFLHLTIQCLAAAAGHQLRYR